VKTFKYVCIQLIRFLPMPFVILVLAWGGIGLYTSLDFDVGPERMKLLAILLIVFFRLFGSLLRPETTG